VSSPVPSRLQLDLPADRPGLARVLAALESHLSAHQVPHKAVARALLVLEEAFMNVVMHGHRPHQPVPSVQFWLALQDDSIELCLIDDGPAFDPRSAVRRERPGSLDEARPGGLGVELIKTFARTVAYEYRDRRNVLRLRLAKD